MKKDYLTPLIETTVLVSERLLLDHSDDHMSAKGVNFEGDDEDEPVQKENLWDGWDD